MAQNEPLKKENALNDCRRQRKKAELPSGLPVSNEEGINSNLSRVVNLPMDIHARLLADARSDKQRTDLAIQLQQHYGNRYVQRVVERSKGLAPGRVSQSANPGFAGLKSNDTNTSLSVRFRALVKSEQGGEEGEAKQPAEEQTIELPGSKDSISPAYISLAQQTSVGGSAMEPRDHGSYTPVFAKNVDVKKIGGVFTNDWEVSASLVINYRYSIQSLGKTDIPNEYADAVGPDTWRDIVTDLRPMSGGIPRSPRFRYWCSDLSAGHEMYHIMDCTQAFKTFLPLEETWLGQQSVAGRVSAERMGYQAMEQLIARVQNYMGSGSDAPQEARAYGAGVSQYAERAQAVEDRSFSEGWMDEGDEEEYEYEEVDEEEVEEEGETESWWDDLWEDEDEGEEEEDTEEEEEDTEEEEEEYYGDGGYEEDTEEEE